MFGRTHPLFFFLSASDCCAELDALHADDSEFKLETESVDSWREMLLPKENRRKAVENVLRKQIRGGVMMYMVCVSVLTGDGRGNRLPVLESATELIVCRLWWLPPLGWWFPESAFCFLNISTVLRNSLSSWS